MASKSPEKTFRIGLVSASVFANEVDGEGGKRTIRNVNLQRRYRDGDAWKSTSSFGVADIPVAMRVLQLAQEYVEQHEVETSN